MMVFDASTLILTARIGLLPLFAGSYQARILIPDAVEREACRKGQPGAAEISSLIETGRIEVVRIGASRRMEKLEEDLAIGRGEAAAILVAQREGANMVATDDRNAIRACRLLGLGFTSAPALLVRAVEKGIVGVQEGLAKLEKLQAIGRYRVAIIAQARAAIEEVN
jgi:predicted nucleic acid-binding protein